MIFSGGPSATIFSPTALIIFSFAMPCVPAKIIEMVHIQKISSLDLPELAPYRSLKRSAEHAKLGIFVVEGDKVLHRLLDSEFTVVSVLLLEARLAEFEPLLRARPEKDIAVFV